jgi:hypothetical protein
VTTQWTSEATECVVSPRHFLASAYIKLMIGGVGVASGFNQAHSTQRRENEKHAARRRDADVPYAYYLWSWHHVMRLRNNLHVLA